MPALLFVPDDMTQKSLLTVTQNIQSATVRKYNSSTRIKHKHISVLHGVFLLQARILKFFNFSHLSCSCFLDFLQISLFSADEFCLMNSKKSKQA